MSVSQLVDDHLRNYAYHTLSRNLCTLIDGFTLVNRKIISATLKKWRSNKNGKSMKIPELQGYTSALTNYHHGPVSMCQAIIGLAQSFVGSNNLPLLYGEGRFGTIEKGGSHASDPRYLSVRPSPLLYYIIRDENRKLLEHEYSDGIKVEPKHFITTIPMVLVNGSKGVAMGSSSYIPAHHPLDVIDAILNRLDGKSFEVLTPWYRGFRGNNYLENGYFISEGVIDEVQGTSYVLSCLPVGVWNQKYKDHLQEKYFNNTLDDYEPDCTATKTLFRVYGYKVIDPTSEESQDVEEQEQEKPKKRGRAAAKKEPKYKTELTMEDICAVKKRKLSNMVLLDVDGFPSLFRDSAHIQEYFYTCTLPFYQKRKEYQITTAKTELDKLLERIAYAEACANGKLKFTKGGKTLERITVLERIEELGLQKGFYLGCDGYTEVKQRSCDPDGLRKLYEKRDKLIRDIEVLTCLNIKDMWKADLTELRDAYIQVYGDDQ